MMIPIAGGALEKIPKVFVKWLEDLEIWVQEETIQTTTALRLASKLRRVLETWGHLLSLQLQERNHSLTLEQKTLKRVNNNNEKEGVFI